MKQSKYLGLIGFTNDENDLFFFGTGGYIDVLDGVIVAHILLDKYKLATSDFSDLSFGAQELVTMPAGLVGMAKHLDVPSDAFRQSRLPIFRHVQSGNISLIKLASWNAIGRIHGQ